MNEDFDLDALLAAHPDFLVEDILRTSTPFAEAYKSYETALPRGYLSQSQTGAYLKCGHAYELRYVLGASTPSNSSMAQGSAVHAAGDALVKSIIVNAPITIEAIEASYSDAHDKYFDPNNDLILAEDDQDLGVVKDRGLDLVRLYHRGVLGQHVEPVGKGETLGPPLRALMPIASERAIHATLTPKDAAGNPTHEPVPFVAILDIEEPHVVRDLKVRRKLPVLTEAENSLQLSIYAGVTEKSFVSIDALIRPSAKLPARYKRFEAMAPPEAKNHAATIVAEVADDIRAGRFRRTSPENWWCSAGWCGYWNICRGKKL